MVKIY